jgi:hypothetical protein
VALLLHCGLGCAYPDDFYATRRGNINTEDLSGSFMLIVSP